MSSQYDKEIDRLTDEIASRRKKLVELQQKRAEYYCPFKLGDILFDNKGRKAKLSKITPNNFDKYTLHAHYLKKDGAPKQIESRLWQWDGWGLLKR